MARLAGLARQGALSVEDMEGGTFTISNGGVFGSLFGTPIINPPQSAILGMHGTFERPVAINGKVEVSTNQHIFNSSNCESYGMSHNNFISDSTNDVCRPYL